MADAKLGKLFEDSALYLIGNIVRRMAAFLMIPLYTRVLSPADYGIIELVELLTMISVITLGVSAVGDAMVRIYHDEREENRRKRIISTSILLVAAISLALYAVAAGAAEAIGAAVLNGRPNANLIRTAFLALVFSNIVEIGLVYQRLRQRALMFVVFSTAQMIFGLGLNIYLLVFAKLGVYGFILSKLIYSICGCAVLMPLVFREVGVGFSLDSARRVLSFGGPLILTSVSFFVIHFADRFFLKAFAGLGEVGVYALAYRFAFLITFLVGEPFGSAWNVRLYARVQDAGWKQEFSRVARYLVLCLFLAGIGLMLFADNVMKGLAGPLYSGAALTIPVLALAYIGREIGDFFRGMLFINKRVTLFSRITIACAILNLILNYVLIKPYGAMGAASATLFTWLAYMAACWIAAQVEHSIPSIVSPVVSMGALYTAVWIAARWASQFPLATKVMVDGLILCAVFLLLWITNYIPRRERATIVEYVTVRLGKVQSLWLKPLPRV